MAPRPSSRRHLHAATLATFGAAALLAGCGGGGPATPPASGDVTKALLAFGADVSPPQRPDLAGNPVAMPRPPLGELSAVNVRHELYSAGNKVVGSSGAAARGLLDHGLATPGAFTPPSGRYDLLPAATGAWATGPSPLPGDYGDTHPRVAVGCDVDRDDLQEIVTVYKAADGVTYLRVDGGKRDAYAALVTDQPLALPASAAALTTLDLACGDLRGDGTRLLAVAWGGSEVKGGVNAPAGLRIYDPAQAYAAVLQRDHLFDGVFPADLGAVRLAAGDLDGDRADELLVGTGGSFFILDFSVSGGVLAASTPTITQEGSDASYGFLVGYGPNPYATGALISYWAKNTAVAIGDLRATGRPTAIAAGVFSSGGSGASYFDPYYLVALVDHDRATGKYAVTRQAFLDASRRGGICGGGSNPGDATSNYWSNGGTPVQVAITEVMLKTVQFKEGAGRGPVRLLLNDTVYDADLVERFSLPSRPEAGYPDGKTGCFFRNQSWWGDGWDLTWGRGHAAVAVGVFDETRYPGDVIVVAQPTRPGYAVFAPNAGGSALVQVGTIATGAVTTANAPLLAAVDVTDESLVLRYTGHSMQLTEPIPVAALAAPPCWSGTVQNIGNSCYSSFGVASTSSSGSNGAFFFGASLRIGAMGEVPFDNLVGSNFGAEISVAASFDTRLTWGSEVSLSKEVTINSGNMEDLVVFATVPYDIYSYTVRSAPPSVEARPGDIITVSVPREPQVLAAERGFYNRVVSDIAPNRAIGAETFRHAIGNPSSYPTKSQRDALLLASGYAAPFTSNVSNLVSPPTTATGSTDFTLELARTRTFESETNFSVNLSLRANAGYAFQQLDYTAGGGFGFSWEASEATSYGGHVGGLDPATAAGKTYRTGLFEFQKKDHPSGFQFPVVTYWVE